MMDITERRITKEKLDKSEAHLVAVQRIAHVGSWEFDVLRGKITWSQEKFSIFGLDPSEPEPTYAQLIEMIHPDDRASFEQALSRVRADATSYAVEYRIWRRDGQLRYIESKAEAVFDDAGQLIQLFGVARDITDRKIAEEKLKKSEAHLLAAQRVAHVGSWEFDAGSGKITWSEEKFRIFGLDPSEPEPTYAQLIEMIHPDDRASFEQALSRVRSGETSYEVEYRIWRRDGQLRYIESKAEAVFDDAGQLIQLCGTARDITKRTIAEEKLRKSETHLLAAQRIAHVGSWEFDVLTGKLTWSKEKCRIFGLNPSEPEPTYTQLIEMIHPDDRASFEQAVSRALTDGTSYEITFRIKRPNGQVRYIETKGEAIFNGAGQAIQLFGIVVDITERKLAEEETLKALQRERELSEAKSRFIAMTSHDLRTPLTTVQSSVELLKRYSEQLSQVKKQEHLNRISSAIEQMNSMVQDVLLLSEAEAGKLQLNPAPFDLVQLCHSLLGELLVADKKQHKITFTHLGNCAAALSGTDSHEGEQEAPIESILDGKLVRYILTNLLSNALKYSPQGSTIQFDLTCHPNKVVFRVQDQGIGIPSEDIPRLFESFYRASNVGATPGTGLGLAIVKQCVDLHGGEISVDSVVGEGTTFTVTLPLNNMMSADIPVIK